MSAMSTQSSYEVVKGLPVKIRTLTEEVRRVLRIADATDKSVRRDLSAYDVFLTNSAVKVTRATDSLLEKPKVVAYLKGDPCDEEDLETRVSKLRKQLLALEAQLHLCNGVGDDLAGAADPQ